MKTIIAGGREYKFTETDIQKLDEIHSKEKITEVVSGGATGADSGGEDWAKSRSIPIKPFLADWTKYGNAAGPIRNEKMARYADTCVLFPGNRGTNDMYKRSVMFELKIHDFRIGDQKK